MMNFFEISKAKKIGAMIVALGFFRTPAVNAAALNACDVNGDGRVDISDVQTEVNEALQTTSCTNDLNQDGVCNVLDVQLIANAVITGTCNATTPPNGLPPVPATGAYLGYQADQGYTQIPTMETTYGRNFAIWHGDWNDAYQYPASGDLTYVLSHDATPMVTLANANRTLAEIINNQINPNDKRANFQNTPDSLFLSWANGLKALGKPVYLRLDHEMNGNWYQYCFQNGQSECKDQDTGAQQTPSDYVNAWRHVHDLFRNAGANNVAFVWCPNQEEGAGTGAPAMSTYYPGDAYVDWTCFDAYNWNNPPANTTPSVTFTQMITKTYNDIRSVAPTKPIMIGEFNTDLMGDPTGNAKGAWLEDAYYQIQNNFTPIKAAVVFDVNTIPDGGNQPDWRITDTAAATTDFKQAIAPSYFLSQ